MKIKPILLALLLAAALTGCSKHPKPRHIVILIDVSGSIERTSLDQAFKAIEDLAGHLQRGDGISIIPILGDAEAQASGQIIRFEVPARRQAYDSDLSMFREKLKRGLTTMRQTASAHPGSKTDILGSMELAQQEFHGVPGQSRQMLFVLSDFIQEDRDLDFRTDQRMASTLTARDFAKHITTTASSEFTKVEVFLGLLRSKEYVTLSRKRRAAIRGFWLQYFSSCDVQPVYEIDGPTSLERM